MDGPGMRPHGSRHPRGNGIADDYRSCATCEPGISEDYEGTHDVHALIIGQSITGLTRSNTTLVSR